MGILWTKLVAFFNNEDGRVIPQPNREILRFCNCKKSRCLNMRCRCFSGKSFCTEACQCQDCSNTTLNQDRVSAVQMQLECRNPAAFQPDKMCNCKKITCTTKHCRCFKVAAACTNMCKCEACANPHGIKGNGQPTP